MHRQPAEDSARRSLAINNAGMTLEKQVVSLELAKKLKELGMRQKSLFAWYREATGEARHLTSEQFYLSEILRTPSEASAFTVAELGEMLPGSRSFRNSSWLEYWKYDVGSWTIELKRYVENGAAIETLMNVQAVTEADARAKMLICLLENKSITLT